MGHWQPFCWPVSMRRWLVYISAMRFASVLLLVTVAACSGSSKKSTSTTTKPPTEPTEPARFIKKVSLTWTFQKNGSSSTVYLVTTDETGKSRSNPMGDYPGECVAQKSTSRAVVVAACKSGAVGIELHVFPNNGELIVLKVPVADGAAPDPMSGTRLQAIPVPADAKIEAG